MQLAVIIGFIVDCLGSNRFTSFLLVEAFYIRRTYLFIPWNVLLAMSMMPPVGLVTAPTKPFPTPLKKPVAPSFWAPRKKKDRVFDNWIKNENGINSWNIHINPKELLYLPLIGFVTIPVMPLTKP